MLTNIRLFFVLMLVFRLGEVVFADKEATESVEIRADVQPYVEIELLDGKNGIELVDEKQELMTSKIKFRLDGNFLKANLSFEGTDGLAWSSSYQVWSISRPNSSDEFKLLMSFSGYGGSPIMISGGRKIEVNGEVREKELEIFVSPANKLCDVTPGLYKGRLSITVEASD